MFKNIFKKTKAIALIVFILNLGLGSLFLAPTQTQAFMNPQEVFDTMTNLNDGAELAELTQNELISIIQNSQEIPENLKPYLIDSIQNDENITDAVKEELINIIQNNGVIPEDLKLLVISAMNGNNDISGPVKSWILGLLLKHIDIEHICKSLSDAAANIMVLGTTIGTPMAILITQICPIILNEILQAFLQTLPAPPAPSNIQTIQYPIFESYQWEIGIPGFTKPGEITPFK